MEVTCFILEDENHSGLQKIFNNNKTIEFSEKILSKFGNISSVSVLLVLKEILKKKNKGIFLMAALGPGFSAGLSAIKIR